MIAATVGEAPIVIAANVLLLFGIRILSRVSRRTAGESGVRTP
jgi:hypothetical protein